MKTTEKTATLVLVAGLLFGAYFLFSALNTGPSPSEPRDETTEVETSPGEENGSTTDDLSKSPYEDTVTTEAEARRSELTSFYPDYRKPDSRLFEEVSGEVNYGYEGTGNAFREGEAVAGVFVADVDNNYREDILAIGGDGPALFRNVGGVFERDDSINVSEGVTSALFFDHDNDGYEDLYLLSDEGSVFLENDGGEFEADDVGLPTEYSSVRGASAADYTGNGCLDVFVVQAGDWTDERPAGYDNRSFTIDEDNGNENRLFAGDCDGFEETTEEAGIEGEAWSLATSFVDLTNDGYPDIHVANDFNNDVIYLNDGDGTFERNVLPDFTDRNGMSSEVADITGNGYLDIFVSNIHYGEVDESAAQFGGRAVEGNNLLLNEGDGSFTDAADEYNVRVGGWGWSALLKDFDNEGNLDLIHSVTATLDSYPAFWQSDGSGFTRVDSSAAGFEKVAGFGVAALDYNNDGSLDVAFSNRGTPAPETGSAYHLYENLGSGSYLRVAVEGSSEAGTDIGTTVTVAGGNKDRTRVKSSRADYMSQSSRILHFGLGSISDEVVDVVVEFPGGDELMFEDIGVNRTVSVSREGLSTTEVGS